MTSTCLCRLSLLPPRGGRGPLPHLSETSLARRQPHSRLLLHQPLLFLILLPSLARRIASNVLCYELGYVVLQKACKSPWLGMSGNTPKEHGSSSFSFACHPLRCDTTAIWFCRRKERKSTLLSVITGTSQPLSSPGAG